MLYEANLLICCLLMITVYVQVDLEAIRKDQSAVISSVAKALQSSRKNGVKRPGTEKVEKPVVKKSRYSSDSEDDSISEGGESEEEDVALPKVEVAALPAVKEVAAAAVH